MAKLVTHCKECCFLEDKTKTCKNNLLNIYTERGSSTSFDDQGNPIIDRICQYKRSRTWNINKSEKEKLIEVKQEVYIRGTIIIVSHSKDDLAKAIQDLNKQKNIRLFKFIIIHQNIKYSEVLDVCKNNIPGEYQCFKIFDEQLINFQIYKSLEYAKNGFLFIIEADKEIDPKLIDKINHIVNEKLFRLLHVHKDSSLHQSVSMINIYKWLKGDLQCPISEKLEDIANEENGESHVFNWEEINEHYIN